MSLVAWWKLDGDLLDYSGNGNHLSYNNNNGLIIQNANGKINGCYERTALNTYTDWLGSAKKVNLIGDFTMCCWAYVMQCHAGTANGLVTNHNHSTNQGAGITVKHISDTDFRISCNTGTGTSRTYCTYYGTSNIKDRWAHLVVRFEKATNNLSLWVDGVKEKELTYAMSVVEDYVGLFRWSINYNSTSYLPKCKLDDVRIYDHALSEKEIKELAKAKILHYKFDDFQEPTENLLLNTDQVVTSSNYAIKDYPLKTPLEEGRTYTISMKATLGEGKSYFGIYNSGGSVSPTYLSSSHLGSDGVYRRTFTWSVGSSSNTFLRVYHMPSSTIVESTIEWIQVEEKPYTTPFTSDVRPGTVYDCSGYDNHATLALDTTPKWTDDAKIGSGAYDFGGSTTKSVTIPSVPKLPLFTLSAWVYNVQGDSRQSILRNFWEIVGTSITFWSYDFADIYWRTSPSGVVPYDQWTHIATTWDGSVIRHYANGLKVYEDTRISSGTSQDFYSIGGYPDRVFSGKLDDVRIYATALSDEDIKELYQTRASLDDKGNLYVQGINQPTNIGEPVNQAIINKVFANGLSRYTQSNCQVTLTNQGYRIYRPPNLTRAEHGNTMYGGLCVQPLSIDPAFFKKGHTYKITFDVNGKSTNNVSSSGIYLTNNMGWGGGGLSPTPRIIKNDSAIGSNFQGHKHAEYVFEIIDDVYKVCTSSYSRFVEGETYPSYRDVAYGFTYADTGEMGTDIYITNFKIMDITDTQLNTISNSGTILFEEFSELGPTDGLIAYYPLNGNVQDYSGNGFHATTSGLTITPGINGSAYQFDGSADSYIDISGYNLHSADMYGSGATFSCWVKPNSHSTVIAQHFAGFHYFTINASGKLQNMIRNYDGNVNFWVYGNKVLPIGEWSHVVCVVENGVGGRYYVNGELDGVGNNSGVRVITRSTPPRLGFYNGKSLDGSMTEARIYNKALTSEEVQILYNVTKPNRTPMQVSADGTIYLGGEING